VVLVSADGVPSLTDDLSGKKKYFNLSHFFRVAFIQFIIVWDKAFLLIFNLKFDGL
jgi:hypothetical protein